MQVGDIVTVLPPFAVDFPGEYEVTHVDEGNALVLLNGVESAFDFKYVEKKE